MGKGKGTGSGRPPKERPKRVSGTGYDPQSMEGKAAIAHLKYKRLSADGKTYEIDTDEIARKVREYVDIERRTKVKTITVVNKKTGAVTTYDEEYEIPISWVGLRIALGIRKSAYCLWCDGYVSQRDKDSEDVVANIQLMEAICAGDEEVTKYLVEDQNKDTQHKGIELLKSKGEISPQQVNVSVSGSFELGKFKKMAH